MKEVNTLDWARSELEKLMYGEYEIGMDIPQARSKDIGWLNRNISVNNANHPNILKALWIIKQLIKEENGK
jgi:hypothetical protein